MLDSRLKEMGFEQTASDPCLYAVLENRICEIDWLLIKRMKVLTSFPLEMYSKFAQIILLDQILKLVRKYLMADCYFRLCTCSWSFRMGDCCSCLCQRYYPLRKKRVYFASREAGIT